MIDVQAPPLGLTGGTLTRLARGAMLAFVLQSAGAGLGYVLHVVLAHLLGTEGFGAYAYAVTWATVLSLFAGLGLQAAAIRFVPLLSARGEHARVAGIVRGGRLLTLAASVAFAVAGTAVALALGSERLVGGLAPTVVGLWLIPSLALVDFNAYVARAQGRVATAYAPWYVLRPLLVLGTAALLFAAGVLTATSALVATLAVFVALTLVQHWLVHRGLPDGVRAAAPAWEPQTWLAVALPLLAVGGFQIALVQTDILIVGALGGTEAAAYYTAASKTALLVGFLLLALNVVAPPLFAPLKDRGRRDELQRLVSVCTTWVFWPSVAVAVLLALVAPQVLRLFGPDFLAARWPLTILLVAQVANAAFGSVGYLLSMTGYHHDTARVYGITAAANVGLCFAGMQLFGMEGAALATTISVVAWNLWLHRLTIRRLGIDSSIVAAVRRSRIRTSAA